jgi:hypothetical protein
MGFVRAKYRASRSVITLHRIQKLELILYGSSIEAVCNVYSNCPRNSDNTSWQRYID